MSGISLVRRRVGCQVRLLEKLLNDEIRSRARTSQTQARVFSEEVHAVLRRHKLKRLASAEVVARLVEIAKRLWPADVPAGERAHDRGADPDRAPHDLVVDPQVIANPQHASDLPASGVDDARSSGPVPNRETAEVSMRLHHSASGAREAR